MIEDRGIPFGMGGRIPNTHHSRGAEGLISEIDKTVIPYNGNGTIYVDESIEENERRWEAEENSRNGAGGER